MSEPSNIVGGVRRPGHARHEGHPPLGWPSSVTRPSSGPGEKSAVSNSADFFQSARALSVCRCILTNSVFVVVSLVQFQERMSLC